MKPIYISCAFKTTLILCFSFFANQTLAAKYALVVGGASKNIESSQHEFARVSVASTIGLVNKGYDVTTFFGTVENSQEQQKYKPDYTKIASLSNTKKTATVANIDTAFDNIINKAQAGDSVEVLISAHGADSCGELGKIIKNDIGSGCQHTFTVFDKNGIETQYPSEKILYYVKRLEEKGAQANVIFSSCHSGRAKDAFKKLDLKNSCAFFQSAGNELGYGCFEDDPDFAKDFTSSSEYLALRYYKDSLAQLEKDPYFSKSACFQKTTKYFRDNNMDLSSMSSAFWSSRRSDQTFQSPALSSLLSFRYFTSGAMQSQVREEQGLSCEQLRMANTSLIKQLSTLEIQISSAVTNSYDKSLMSYNRTVDDLRLAIERSDSPSQISKKQLKVKKMAENVMLQERKLIDDLFKHKIKHKKSDSLNDPCTRPLE